MGKRGHGGDDDDDAGDDAPNPDAEEGDTGEKGSTRNTISKLTDGQRIATDFSIKLVETIVATVLSR